MLAAALLGLAAGLAAWGAGEPVRTARLWTAGVLPALAAPTWQIAASLLRQAIDVAVIRQTLRALNGGAVGAGAGA